MSTGKPVVEIIEIMPPATAFATIDSRPGGSTPAEANTVYDFDASATEYLAFKCRLSEHYAGGGLTFVLPWSATSATTGGVYWQIAIRRIADDAEDLDASHTYDFNGVADTCASASGELSYPTITFTSGADMDSWAAGEMAIVRVARKHDDAGDDMAGDAELHALIGRET